MVDLIPGAIYVDTTLDITYICNGTSTDDGTEYVHMERTEYDTVETTEYDISDDDGEPYVLKIPIDAFLKDTALEVVSLPQ